MLISAAMPSPAFTPSGQPKSDGNATTSATTDTPQVATQSHSSDQMAEALQIRIKTLHSHVESIKQLNEYLNNGYRPPNISDDTYANYLKDIKGMRDGLVESVKTANESLTTNFSVSGDLPASQSDGKWSSGSFTVSTSGKGFGIRADTFGNMTMSRNGSPYVSWPSSEFASLKTTSAANVALQVMGRMTSLNVRA